MEIQRQTESFAYRVAATMNFDKAEDLEGEFMDWFDENKEAQELDPVYERGGPLGSWTNIEKFFQDRYPAAYQGFTAAYEQAPLALEYNGYDSGPEAIAKHGYDPLEIAANMFYLHNLTDGARAELREADEQRIIDIMQKQQDMHDRSRQASNHVAAPKNSDIILYRGLGLDFREPGMEKIKAILHPHFDPVPGESLGEAYLRSQKDEEAGDYTHPGKPPEDPTAGYEDEEDESEFEIPPAVQEFLDNQETQEQMIERMQREWNEKYGPKKEDLVTAAIRLAHNAIRAARDYEAERPS